MPPDFLDTFFPARTPPERLKLLADLYLRQRAETQTMQAILDQLDLENRTLASAADAMLQSQLGRIALLKERREIELAALGLEQRRLAAERLLGALARVSAWLMASITPEGLDAWEAAEGASPISQEELLAEVSLAVADARWLVETDAGQRSGQRSPTVPRES
jgi:hypothetical protein